MIGGPLETRRIQGESVNLAAIANINKVAQW